MCAAQYMCCLNSLLRCVMPCCGVLCRAVRAVPCRQTLLAWHYLQLGNRIMAAHVHVSVLSRVGLVFQPLR